MKKLIFHLIILSLAVGAKAQTYSGILDHTNSYFTIRPYSSSYDDGSYSKIYYDGNNKLLRFYNSESSTTYTSIVVGNGTFDGNVKTFKTFYAYDNIELDPRGNAMGDNIGFKVTETGNNSTKFHVYRNFTGDSGDKDLMTIDKYGNTKFIGPSKVYWDPQGTASGDLMGFKVTESGNNTTKLHIFRNFTGDNSDRDRMVIDAGGNIGIGNSSPDHKLDVNGTVHSKEVIVDLNVPGPDYVFEEDYPLQDLTSLEQYLKANKHLPEVPSAAEMEQDGIKVGEMEMLLLKKVEELTLHLIKQQKEIEKLKQKINDQN